MNLRALTRGDAAVAGAAVLLLVSSILPFESWQVCPSRAGSCQSGAANAWHAALFPVLPSVFLLGIAAAALILLQRLQHKAAQGRQVLGLRLDQWGTAFSVAALWTELWSLTGGSADQKNAMESIIYSHSFGAWLGLLALLVLTGVAAAGPLVPAIQAPLLPARPARPAAPQGYQPFQPAGARAAQYGYPGGPVPGQNPSAGQPSVLDQMPVAAHSPAAPGTGYGQQPGGYPYRADASPQEQTAVLSPIRADASAPASPAASAEPFQPFWFAVPAVRPLGSKDSPGGPPVGELVPGTWYLAVDQQGHSLVAQLPDGQHGLLSDTSGIQRG